MPTALQLPDGVRRRLADAARSPGVTAVSHHSAAHLHGLTADAPALVHVLAVRGSHPATSRDVIVHHTRWLDPSCVVDIGGVPVTDVPSTIVMMAAYTSADETRAMIDVARRGAITIDELRRVANARRRRGRAGPARLIGVLDEIIDESRAA